MLGACKHGLRRSASWEWDVADKCSSTCDAGSEATT